MDGDGDRARRRVGGGASIDDDAPRRRRCAGTRSARARARSGKTTSPSRRTRALSSRGSPGVRGAS
eukprot:27556-Pelagococcus_subviridis.AAC.2